MSWFDNPLENDVINLQIGAPGDKFLQKAMSVFLSTIPSEEESKSPQLIQLFQYGASPGNDLFLQSCSQFLSEQYNDSVKPESLFLTCGATHGLSLIASTLVDMKNGVVFVEDPTYFLALDILHRDLGCKI